ncbi:MAG: transcription factor FapR [Oscillospiraceae bacterium]|nr:transcription factor FapR [Oscillospiraceae bacterium]
MSRTSAEREARRRLLAAKVAESPFVTDEELSGHFGVSLPTIRLDRMALGIPELRERIKAAAEVNQGKVRTLKGREIVGEVIEARLNERAVSYLTTTESMTFERTRVVRGHYIYSLAESLALAIIDAQAALVGVANVKYVRPVYAGDGLVARAEVRARRDNKLIVWVIIAREGVEVFRGKFILVAIDG